MKIESVLSKHVLESRHQDQQIQQSIE